MIVLILLIGQKIMHLSKQLKKYLHIRNMRASDLSRRTGIAPSVLSEWLAGREPKSLSKIIKTAEALGISIDDLVRPRKFDFPIFDQIQTARDLEQGDVLEIKIIRVQRGKQ